MFGNSIRSCGRFGPATLGTTVAKIQFEFLRIVDLALLRNAPKPLRVVIIFVELAMLLAAAGRAQ